MNTEQNKRVLHDIDHIERRLYYEYYECHCPDEMMDCYPECQYDIAKKRLAELKAML